MTEERVFSTEDGLERLVLFAAAGCSLYAFVGAGFLETLGAETLGIDGIWEG